MLDCLSKPKNVETSALGYILDIARQIYEFASPFEKAIVARILGERCPSFKLLTVEDCLADIICGGNAWEKYLTKFRHLGYLTEFVPLVLYILIEDGKEDKAKMLFKNVSTSEEFLQKKGHIFSQAYAEIMKWVAEKINFAYTPPKEVINTSEKLTTIVRAVLNFEKISSQERIRVKNLIENLLTKHETYETGLYNVIELYFMWKFLELSSRTIPSIEELKPRIKVYLLWTKIKYYSIYHTVRVTPSIAYVIGKLMLSSLSSEGFNLATTIVPPLIILVVMYKLFSGKLDQWLARWQYIKSLKEKIQRDKKFLEMWE